MLITSCPSRKRPDIARRMFDSYKATKTGKGLMVMYVSYDDPTLEQYQKLYRNEKELMLIVGERIPVVQAYNLIPTVAYPNQKYYSNVNDDHVYRTKGWDEFLIQIIEDEGKGWGVATPRDAFDKDWNVHQHPGAETISGNLIRTLGHVFYPKLKHLGADEYLKHIALGINRYFYCPEILTEHMHAHINKAEKDTNYSEIYTDRNSNYKDAVLLNWVMAGEKDREINKIKKEMTDGY